MIKEVKLFLNGRSGCNVVLHKSNGITVVRKSTDDKRYQSRLFEQMQKQNAFVSDSVFMAPKLITESSTETFFFDMEYIPGEKYSDFLTRLSKIDLDKLINHYISFFEKNLVQSQNMMYDNSVFKHKAESLKKAINDRGALNNLIINALDSLMFDIPKSPLPIGYCHGDFTFSNMIFFNGSVFLIDFLDSFVDTPLIDLVKIRQDTCFKWTLLIDKETEQYKRDKTWQILNYIDFRINNYFEQNSYYNIWYNYLQKFNLLRIFPYLFNEEEKKIIIQSLKTL